MPTTPAPSIAALAAAGRGAGLDAIGVASAEPFASTLAELRRRRDDGSHGGMAFTYRNPERSTDPARTLGGVRTLVVGARAYPASTPPAPGERPHGRVAAYARVDHYGELRRGLDAVAAALTDDGWAARVVLDDNALVDRPAAHRAGIGWFGKNANLLLPGHGSRFVLGSVLTDAAIEPSPGPVPDGCGPCTRCLDACPTAAFSAPGVLDARRCLAWLVQADGVFPVEHRAALGDRLYGCDDCQDACPINRRADRDRPDGRGGDGAWVDLIELLRASDDELIARHGRWYIPRRDPRYLRRNALVVLANTADGADPEVASVLRLHLDRTDALVRAHAVWAADRLGRRDLLVGLDEDDDPLVRAELDRLAPAGPS